MAVAVDCSLEVFPRLACQFRDKLAEVRRVEDISTYRLTSLRKDGTRIGTCSMN